MPCTERRYAQIEKELLAVVFGLESFNQYVYGKEVEVESDQKPLEAIMQKSFHHVGSACFYTFSSTISSWNINLERKC